MKVSAKQLAAEEKQRQQQKHLISIWGDKPKVCTKENSLKLTLRSNPSDENSATYDETIPYLEGDESLSQVYAFFDQLHHAFEGQNLKEGKAQANLASRLLHDQFKTKFDDYTNTKTITPEDVTIALVEVAKLAVPQRALLTIRRFIRRYGWKPRTMPVNAWMTNMLRIRNKLIPWLASLEHNYRDADGKFVPFDEATALLPMDEFMDLCHQYIHKEWVGQMVLHKFEPSEHTPEEFVNFCKTLEFAEQTNPTFQVGANNSNAKKPPRKKKADIGDVSLVTGKRKHCALHGDNDSHTTDTCFTIKSWIKRDKAGGDFNASTNNSPNKRPRFGNKTWKNNNNNSNGDKKQKAFDKTKYNKYKESPELNAFVAMATKKVIQKTVHQELQAFLAEQQEQSTTDVAEASNIETITADDAFNFEDFQKLHLSDTTNDDNVNQQVDNAKDDDDDTELEDNDDGHISV